ncbi:hypothetical protein [Flavobacterium beibuense]|uniref:hypothetical protein n=1 Tax=Flavobacterium beibuense TaxID=657326 RepID=UPI003A90A1E8
MKSKHELKVTKVESGYIVEDLQTGKLTATDYEKRITGMVEKLTEKHVMDMRFLKKNNYKITLIIEDLDATTTDRKHKGF